MSTEHLEHEVGQLVYRIEELEERQNTPDRAHDFRAVAEEIRRDVRELRQAVIELGRLTARNTDSIEALVIGDV